MFLPSNCGCGGPAGWVVALRQRRFKDDVQGFQGYFHSSGSLVSKNLVVTAASVFERSKDVELFEALPGAKDFTYTVNTVETGESIYEAYGNMRWLKVTKIFIHPYYKKPVSNQFNHPINCITLHCIEYNVAIVKLELDVETAIIDRLNWLCLPTPHQTPLEDLTNLVNDEFVVKQTRNLRPMKTMIITNSECSEDYVSDQVPHLGEIR